MPSGKTLQECLKKAQEAWTKHGGAHGFSFGLPDGEELQKQVQKAVEKTLKKFQHEHGFAIPWSTGNFPKSLKIKKFSTTGPHTYHVFPGQKGAFTLKKGVDTDIGVKGKARIRVEIDGREVLDK